jgi:NAD(P)-dependent dehydrogenase (short-subunit alcohol dehydrogenase family)
MSKVAVVTGAGSGIGRASARALYQANYCVVLAGRHRENLQDTCQEWTDSSRYLIVPTDVTQVDQVQRLFQATVDKFGTLHILFNNAGINSPPVPLDEIDPATFQQVMNVNVMGTFLCSQEAWKIMKANGGGRIINNGSLSAHVPRPFSVPYTTSKHAMTGLTKCLNLDGRSLGICCSQIDIGNAESSMTERLATMGALQPNGTVQTEPILPVETVAETIVYLANLPLDVNVPFLTILPREMPYMGRG